MSVLIDENTTFIMGKLDRALSGAACEPAHLSWEPCFSAQGVYTGNRSCEADGPPLPRFLRGARSSPERARSALRMTAKV